MDGLKNLNLLFLEDNEEFAKNTIEILEIYFKKVFHSPDIKEALILFNDFKIDVIISDIKVNDGNGLDFIMAVREIDNEIPIIVLSAHKDEEFLFKAIGLNILSYELKPLKYKSLISLFEKISSKFRLNHKVKIGTGLEYDYLSKELYENNKALKLTKREVNFIELLIKNKDKVVSNDMIQKYVWEDKIMSDAAIKNLVLRIRKKVATDFLTTVTSLGYKLSHIP